MPGALGKGEREMPCCLGAKVKAKSRNQNFSIWPESVKKRSISTATARVPALNLVVVVVESGS